jgi:hypothetical protein
VLVVVTRVKGGAPREPGARMIVAGGDLAHGTIGGGNLERLAIERASALFSPPLRPPPLHKPETPMKRLLPLLLSVALSGSALASDVVVTAKKHADAYEVMGRERRTEPAKDSTIVTWIAKDRMRLEDGERVTIVRGDLKKMYLIDPAKQTYSTLDVPPDMTKYMPAEFVPRAKEMMDQLKLTVTPTGETKQIGQWNATRYTCSMDVPMGLGSVKQEVWATKDVAIDAASLQEMRAWIVAANPMGGSWAEEMKKIDGLPVLTLRTRTVRDSPGSPPENVVERKETEAVTSIEQREAPAGHYDVPAGFTETPFDPMSNMQVSSHPR